MNDNNTKAEIQASHPSLWAERLAMTTSVLALSIAILTLVQPSLFADVQIMTDTDITEAVETQLLLQHGVPFDRIDVDTEDGVVTLTGSTLHLLAKERATEIARSVRGVIGIVNRIEVTPPQRPDNTIRAEITRALYRNLATEGSDARVQVREGAVTLSGTVESAREKELVGRIAKGIKGVNKVSNDISVAHTRERSAVDIKTEIQETFRWDTLIDDALVAIDVDDEGHVALAGFVGSIFEKARAIELARIDGVTRVTADDLKIDPRAEREELRADKFMPRTDAEILAAVDRVFDHDPRVRPFHPKTTVRDGIVTLQGAVNQLAAKRVAERDALTVAGVWHVRNLLKVKPGTPVSDDETANNVREAMRLDPFVDRNDIKIGVHEGQVQLQGTVRSTFEKQRAESAASAAAGVVSIQNDLRVSADGARVQKSDWAITEDIRQELSWSPFVDADDIRVVVGDGVATLSGRVDTWMERRIAEENAFEGGAVEVRNHLDVRYGPEQRTSGGAS